MQTPLHQRHSADHEWAPTSPVSANQQSVHEGPVVHLSERGITAKAKAAKSPAISPLVMVAAVSDTCCASRILCYSRSQMPVAAMSLA